MNQSEPKSATLRPWGSYRIADGESTAVRIGPRDLWLQGRDREIWVAHSSGRHGSSASAPGGEGPAPAPPDDSDWSRWAPPADRREIELVPTMPDRPLVLQPERTFTLLPGSEARVFVRVPLWIRVELAGDPGDREGRHLLFEIPSMELSDTWWGGFLDGELCYWLHTTARREMRPELFSPHFAVCPLMLLNRSREDLRVEKLAFRVAHLTLFATNEGVWADVSRVVYQGDDEGSHIEMSGLAPDEAKGARRIAEPRIPALRGLRARTFLRLREIPGMGGIW